METEQTKTTLQSVRLAILRQHTQLGELMDELEAHATGVLNGKDSAGALHDALVLFHRRFVRHLDYEETELLPLLSTLRPDVATTLRSLVGDHADQRDAINGLLHDGSVFADPRTLAHEALTCVHGIRSDMADEETTLRGLV